MKLNRTYLFFKRALDIIFSFTSIVFLFPIFIILSLIISIFMKGNPFFIQKRPGKNSKIFKLIKFRTMTNKKDKNGNLLPDEMRMTKFGKKLRSLSIDELPELFNILIGNMSLIGPRPQLVKDLVFFDEEIILRQKLRPGLTGLAQVKGRNNIDWETRFKYDLSYVKNVSFISDLKIFFSTILVVLKKSDINTEGMETSEDYGDYLLRIKKIDQKFYNIKINEAKSLLKNN